MIRSFRCRDTERLFNNEWGARFQDSERLARGRLLLLNGVRRLDDLRVPPGNRLEALKGAWAGRFCIRINDQWRICFRWKNEDAFEVEIVDYH